MKIAKFVFVLSALALNANKRSDSHGNWRGPKIFANRSTYASHILSEGGGGIFIVTRETKPLKSMPNVMVVLMFSMAFCTNDNSVALWKKLEVAIRSTNLKMRLALPGFEALE